MLTGLEQSLMALEQAPTSAFDWAAGAPCWTVLVGQVSDLGIEIGLFAAREFLKLFEFVEVKFRLV